ncbi:unnamed protein product [Enterobius vermicularis]|uniref:Uncharacterized protein n=1 Tax=Enterobius vermicularis TaxID=51028 RepID=A0A3P6IHY2_ENTVE|nr:unnamed protein product [Enterobius vermicularis]
MKKTDSGIPLLFTAILTIAVPNFFNREDDFCWVRPDYLIYAVVAPTSVVVFNGLICFFMIMINLFPHLIRSRTITLTHQRSSRRLKIITLILIQFSLGLPWVNFDELFKSLWVKNCNNCTNQFL